MSHCRPAITFSINRSNVAGALQRPKGMHFHLYKPFWTTKVDFWLAFSSRATCQYPDAKCRKPFGTAQRIKRLINSRDGVGILDGHRMQATIILTSTTFAAQRAVSMLNNPSFLEFFDLSHDLFLVNQGVACRSLFDRPRITSAYVVFDHIGSSYVALTR